MSDIANPDQPFEPTPQPAQSEQPVSTASQLRRSASSTRLGGRITSQSRARRDLTWNVLTVLVWLGMACMVMAFVSILVNPASAINPLKPVTEVPPTLVAAVQIPTSTNTPVPSATIKPGDPSPTATLTPTPVTPTVTLTLTPTLTETPTPGPSPTATIHSLYPFILRGDVKMIAAATFPDHDECKLWVAGQAYDLQGAPMVGITVMLGGNLDRKTLYQLSLTGTALQYGQAGYEFTVADRPVNSKQAVWVQLFDQAMMPLSGRIAFDTFDDCSQNLILVNFRQVR